MAPVGLGDHIFFFKGGAYTDCGGLFSYAKMGGSLSFVFFKKPNGGFFKHTCLYHFAVKVFILFPGQLH
jgi:hypothetical protein